MVSSLGLAGKKRGGSVPTCGRGTPDVAQPVATGWRRGGDAIRMRQSCGGTVFESRGRDFQFVGKSQETEEGIGFGESGNGARHGANATRSSGRAARTASSGGEGRGG